jgi:3',5'-cyclic AMP phosphodiesterase CpdA
MLTLPAPTRRAFTLSALGGGALLARFQSTESHWALLSDLHVSQDAASASRGFRPYDNLAKTVAQVAAAAPQAAVCCGDLARNEGLPGDYANLRKLVEPIASKMPVAYAMGNHDHRANFLSAFPGLAGRQEIKDRHVTVLETPGTRLIVLDSLLRTDLVPGLIGKAQRTWLASYLDQSSDLPTVVFVHHPPDDEDGNLLDSPRLLEILKARKKVKALVYGHSHRYAVGSVEGLHLVNLPAVGYNFADADAVGWMEARLSAQGGTFVLHAIGGNTSADGTATMLPWRA